MVIAAKNVYLNGYDNTCMQICARVSNVHKQHAENCDTEREGKGLVGEIDKAHKDKSTAVRDVTQKHHAKNDSHVCFDRISEGVSKCGRRPVVDVKQQCVANERARHRQNEGQHLKEQICLLRSFCCGSCSRSETVCVITASGRNKLDMIRAATTYYSFGECS
jgi:hypothetical protein